MHAEAVDSRSLHPLVPDRIIGGFALPLDRQIDPTLHRRGRLGHQPGAAVIAVGGAGGHHQLLHTIQAHRSFRNLGHLLRGLADHRGAVLKGLLDGAELAGLGAISEADAGLQQRGGQHISAVQQGDGAVGDPLRRAQAIEGRFIGGGHHRQGVLLRTGQGQAVTTCRQAVRR